MGKPGWDFERVRHQGSTDPTASAGCVQPANLTLGRYVKSSWIRSRLSTPASELRRSERAAGAKADWKS